MIVDMFGHTIPEKFRHMDSGHVRALIDGRYFLEHQEKLTAMRIRAYCLTCRSLGKVGDVQFVTKDDGRTDRICAHVRMWVAANKPLEVVELLPVLDLGLECVDCEEPISGDNGQSDSQFEVRCGCTLRRMDNPRPPTPATPASPRVASSLRPH